MLAKIYDDDVHSKASGITLHNKGFKLFRICAVWVKTTASYVEIFYSPIFSSSTEFCDNVHLDSAVIQGIPKIYKTCTKEFRRYPGFPCPVSGNDSMPVCYIPTVA